MTNRHCDTCGDPLFRYQGQEFCATCEGRAQETAQTEAQNAQAQEAGAQATDAQAESAESTTQREAAPTTTTDGQDSSGAVDDPREADQTSEPARGEPTPTPSREQTVEPRRDDGDLAAAHESLIRTLTHHARRAEAVDDPRRATDHLKTVREAAEALAALERGR